MPEITELQISECRLLRISIRVETRVCRPAVAVRNLQSAINLKSAISNLQFQYL
jgi:hypothetical protein